MKIGVFTALYGAEPLEGVLDRLVALDDRGLEISALSRHGNPLHPREPVAARAHGTWRRTLELAEALEVETVIAFSGCPGDGAGASYPNWVTWCSTGSGASA